jgi:hypothetical protein
MIANFSEEELTLPKGTILGVAQEVAENAVFTVDDEEETDRGQDQIFYSGEQKEVPQWFRKYLNEKLAHLSTDEKEIIDLFSSSMPRFSMMKKTTISRAPK